MGRDQSTTSSDTSAGMERLSRKVEFDEMFLTTSVFKLGRDTARREGTLEGSRVPIQSTILLRRGALARKSRSCVMKSRYSLSHGLRIWNSVKSNRFLQGRRVVTPDRISLRNGGCSGNIASGMTRLPGTEVSGSRTIN